MTLLLAGQLSRAGSKTQQGDGPGGRPGDAPPRASPQGALLQPLPLPSTCLAVATPAPRTVGGKRQRPGIEVNKHHLPGMLQSPNATRRRDNGRHEAVTSPARSNTTFTSVQAGSSTQLARETQGSNCARVCSPGRRERHLRGTGRRESRSRPHGGLRRGSDTPRVLIS